MTPHPTLATLMKMDLPPLRTLPTKPLTSAAKVFKAPNNLVFVLSKRGTVYCNNPHTVKVIKSPDRGTISRLRFSYSHEKNFLSACIAFGLLDKEKVEKRLKEIAVENEKSDAEKNKERVIQFMIARGYDVTVAKTSGAIRGVPRKKP